VPFDKNNLAKTNHSKFIVCVKLLHLLLYCIRLKFGIEFILVVWQIMKIAKLSSFKLPNACENVEVQWPSLI